MMKLSPNEITCVVDQLAFEARSPKPTGGFWSASAYTSNAQLLEQLRIAKAKLERAIELTEYLQASMEEPA
jgi:hypothetical protein